MLGLPSITSGIPGGSPAPRDPPSLMQRVMLRESTAKYMKKEGLKDLTSSSLNIKVKELQNHQLVLMCWRENLIFGALAV